MNKKLQEMRRKFHGQKGTIEGASLGSRDYSNIPAGKYSAKLRESELTEEGLWHRVVELVDCDYAGRWFWPWKPDISTEEGVQQTAVDLRRILGEDAIPGCIRDGTGGLTIDYGQFLGSLEDLISQTLGQEIEVTIKDRKPQPDGSHLKDDGTPWQNCYINRGLGDDAQGAEAAAASTPRTQTRASDNLSVTTTKKKKPAVKTKAVAKKKVVRKAAVKRR